jgi:hypothetical protein
MKVVCMSVIRAFQCDYCEELDADQYAGYEIETRNGSETYCENCYECYAWTCEDCELIFGEDVENHDYRCQECHDNREEETVKRHDYKPDLWTMHGEGVAFYGIELEMEAKNSRADAVDFVATTVADNVAIMKEDGSLSSEGFELVSHPHTFDKWNETAGEWSALLMQLEARGMNAWNMDSCGLHVHMTRKGMAPSHQTRFGLLFSRNVADWQSVARRKSSFANFAVEGDTVKKVKHNYNCSHFDAVNFSNRDTIEVRIWRPSLNFKRVLGSIALVHFAREYTALLTSHDVLHGALEWPRFTAWVEAQGHVEASVLLRGGAFEGLVA